MIAALGGILVERTLEEVQAGGELALKLLLAELE